MLDRIESLNRLSRMVLLCGLVLLVSAAGRQSQAQSLRMLQVQDGTVYIDGKQVPADQLPASLDLTGLTLQFQFVGDIEPVIALGDRFYRVAGEQLLEVSEAERTAMPLGLMLGTGADPSPMFPEPFSASLTVPFVTPSVGLDGAMAENDVTAVGQEILLAQANALEQLVEEIERQNRIKGALMKEGMLRSTRIGPAPLLQQPMQGMSTWEAALMAEKLRFQAERLALAARQLPQIEIRSYLEEVQQHDAELYNRLLREQLLEEESHYLAAQVRQASNSQERAMHIEALRNKLEEIFELKQENRRREIEQLQAQLDELQYRLDERERLHQRIIENRIQELTSLPARMN